LDDVLAGVPAGFTFRVGNEGWAAFDRFAFLICPELSGQRICG
jgi:hypothetical protein